MKFKKYRGIFPCGFEFCVRALDLESAKILAKAQAIQAGREWRTIENIYEVPMGKYDKMRRNNPEKMRQLTIM